MKGTQFIVSNSITLVGLDGDGQMTVSNGSVLLDGTLEIGTLSGANGAVSVWSEFSGLAGT